MPIKQITNPNSFLTFHDIGTNEVISLGNAVDGGSSDNVKKIINGTFDGDTGWIQTNDTAYDPLAWEITDGKLISKDHTSSAGIKNDQDTYYDHTLSTLFNVDITNIDANFGVVVRCYDAGNNLVGSLEGGTYWKTNIVNVVLPANTATADFKVVFYRVGSHTGTLEIDNVVVESILPTSTTYTFNSLTMNNAITHKMAMDATSLANIQANPQLLAELADPSGDGTATGVNVTLDASDAWYACSENEGAYCVDARAGYGAEEVANNDFATSDLTGWTFNNCTGVVVGGELETTSTSIIPSARYNFTSVAGKYYKFDFKVRAGTQIGHQYSVFDGENLQEITGSIPYEPSDGKIAIIFKATGNDTGVYVQRDGVTTIGTTYFDNVTVREATASEITNYLSTVRTNADFNPVGLQTTCLTLDGAGVPTAVDFTKLHFYSNGYVDTQWNPTLVTPWTLTETIDTVQQVVVDTDNVNENATYLLGKGTYQKVTADPYTTYEQSEFKVEEK